MLQDIVMHTTRADKQARLTGAPGARQSAGGPPVHRSHDGMGLGWAAGARRPAGTAGVALPAVDPAGAVFTRPIRHLANGSCPWMIGRRDGGWLLSACLAVGMTGVRVRDVSALEILDSRPVLQPAAVKLSSAATAIRAGMAVWGFSPLPSRSRARSPTSSARLTGRIWSSSTTRSSPWMARRASPGWGPMRSPGYRWPARGPSPPALAGRCGIGSPRTPSPRGCRSRTST